MRRLAERIDALGPAQRRDLGKLLGAIRRRERAGQPASVLRAKLAERLEDAERLIGQRRSTRFVLEYPGDLPVARARNDILAALDANRVVIVCGDTGSGKTTQLPKLCLEAGRGILGTIGHTQPRRLAARAVAARLAEELRVDVGGAVGYQVRFTDETNPASLIKVMTDGILLNEIRHDRYLERYDTLIVDEAHERSLNIDFLLGYLKRIEWRRPDLKIIVTSATIDPERFAAHFGDAPILRIEGRTYPVELRYRPPDRDADLPQAVTAAVNELAGTDLEGYGGGKARDTLVFLPGERWIRDAERELKRAGPRGYEVLPLYARLTAARQQKIFAPRAAPRVVLATNIAETSLTVPRIRFVVDSGLARVNRYSTRHRMQALGVEPVARANADQRAGRCGRIAPGICIRLYGEQDFETRPAFMEPEILRTNLAGVILRLEGLGLGHVDDFPFIDPPPTKAVNDAYRLLHLLGALDEQRRLTADGDVMARLPVDPRLSRLLLAAHRGGALREGLVLAAGLSVVDPREQPPNDVGAARQKHAELNDPRSDFVTLLNLWNAYRAERGRGDKHVRKWCEGRYLSATRFREWEDVHHQLKALVRGLGWRAGAAEAGYEAIHRAVLAAFIDFVAVKTEDGRYEGLHQARSALFPGSGLVERRPKWIVAAERVATGRVYLRTAAQIRPAWIMQAAPHLVRREFVEPQWDRRRGRVTAREVVTLSGLTLSGDRRVDYGRVDRDAARRIFIREALAADDLGESFDFIEHNRGLVRRLLDWEAKRRSRDLYAGERAAEAFYAARLPDHIVDRAGLRRWSRRAAADGIRAVEMDVLDIATRDPAEFDTTAYPDAIDVAGHRLPLIYRFDPASPSDGISLRVPLPLLGTLRPDLLDWLVPGWLPAKVLALLRALPKELRRVLVPLPDTVAELLPALERQRGVKPLEIALRDELLRTRDLRADVAFDMESLPAELRMRIEVLDRDGQVLAAGRDAAALQRRFARDAIGAAGVADGAGAGGRSERAAASAAGAAAGTGASRSAAAAAGAGSAWAPRTVSQWDFDDLPDSVDMHEYGTSLALYPALLDVGGGVELRLVPPGPAAVERHRRGVRRLLLKQLPQQIEVVRKRVLGDRELVLSYHGVGTGEQLVDDLLCAAADECFALEPPVRTRADFDRVLDAGRAGFVAAAERLADYARDLLALYRRIVPRVEGRGAPRLADAAADDLAAQLDGLVFPYFLSETPPRWRPHLKRYLDAVAVRLDKLGQRAPKDAEHQAAVLDAARRLDDWQRRQPPDWPWPAEVVDYRWLLEELRVSLFAQQLGTSRPVSARRLQEAWQRAVAA